MSAGHDIAIRMQGVGKRYRLGANHDYRTLRDNIAGLFSRREKPPVNGAPTEIWAVKNLSLEVRRGEVIGIIGRNGSGKSTLLKLLTRITLPDTGRIEYEGRIGALLEVGTGFHPELTGRENIYMNGSILGMTKRDIAGKFDKIVDFSGVEDFLDTPVKRYSSGMRVRLGFAVAAHLDPEILVVDEVLAVGDAEFQRKCLGRMGDVARAGRTVLFVSHQMEAIQSLCTRAVWLEGGRMIEAGPVNEIVGMYLAGSSKSIRAIPLGERTDRTGDGKLRVVAIEIHDGRGRPPTTGGPLEILISTSGLESDEPLEASMRVGIFDYTERLATMVANELTGDRLLADSRQAHFVCSIDRLPLVPGRYSINFALRMQGVLQDKMFPAAYFDVNAGNYFEGTRNEHAGIFHVDQRWRVAS